MFANVRNWIARHPRRAGAGLTLLILLVTGTIWGIRVSERVENLAADLRATGSSAEIALTDADPDKIEEISIFLHDSLRSAQGLDADLWPLRWAGAVVSRIPVIGANVTAIPDLLGRLNDDLNAALALVDAAEVLVSVYNDLPTQNAGVIDTLEALPTESEIMSAIRLIDEAERSLARAKITALKMDDGHLLGRVGRESEELGVQEARLREFIEWAGLSAESLLAMVRLSEVSVPLLALLGTEGPSGSALDRDSLSAMADIETAANDAYLAVSSTNARTPSGVAGSRLGVLLLDFEPLMRALADISRAGVLTWTAVSPALNEMESSQGGLIGEGTSILTALELLEAKRSEFQEAHGILELVAPELRSVELRTRTALSSAQTLSDASVELAHAVDFLSNFPAIGAQALGSDGPARYLVLGQTSDELRGSGGFVSVAWILTFDGGRMSGIEYHDIVEVDDRSRLVLYPLPPELLAQHMDAPVWLLRDSTWSPEYPAAARTAAEIFELGQGGSQLDGVIALTEWAIVGLVEALGTVNTERGAINSEELLPTLEVGTDEEGRAFVDTLFHGVLEELRTPGVNDQLFDIARAASEMLNRKDVMVYMTDPARQDVVSRSGWDGSLGRPEGDRIAVIDSNIGWNKVDRNIERLFEYDVVIRPYGQSEAQLILTYNNMSDPGSGKCDVQAPVHDLSYAELKQSCYWNLFRVYVPDGGFMVANDPLPIPEQSVFARVGAGIPGEDSVDVGVGPGGKFVSGLIVVPPGGSASARFDLIMPSTALVEDGETLTYRLALSAQSGALGRDAVIRLVLPSEYELLRSSHAPIEVSGNVVKFDLRIESDMTLEVTMQRSRVVAGYRFDGMSIDQPRVSIR